MNSIAKSTWSLLFSIIFVLSGENVYARVPVAADIESVSRLLKRIPDSLSSATGETTEADLDLLSIAHEASVAPSPIKSILSPPSDKRFVIQKKNGRVKATHTRGVRWGEDIIHPIPSLADQKRQEAMYFSMDFDFDSETARIRTFVFLIAVSLTAFASSSQNYI